MKQVSFHFWNEYDQSLLTHCGECPDDVFDTLKTIVWRAGMQIDNDEGALFVTDKLQNKDQLDGARIAFREESYKVLTLGEFIADFKDTLRECFSVSVDLSGL